MTDASHSAKPVEFKGGSLAVTSALLRETEPARLADALHVMLGGMPDFFSGEALVLDFRHLEQVPAQIDWTGILSLLRRYQLQPIGTRHLPEQFAASARKAGLALLGDEQPEAGPPAPAAAPLPPPMPKEAPRPLDPPPAPTTTNPTMFVDRPLRSGQQVYARACDLVLLGGVSHGAEVIADGNIHCYGPLRGRALAGAQGDTGARIVSTNFGPELVAIAGMFRTFENGIPESVAGRAATVRLLDRSGEPELKIERLMLD